MGGSLWCDLGEASAIIIEIDDKFSINAILVA